MEILDLEELKENKSEVIDENLKGFMSKDEEVSKLLEDNIGEIDSETEKLNAKEEEIRELEESSREKISMDASPDELIEIAGKIKSAQSELSEINANIEKLENEKKELEKYEDEKYEIEKTKNNIEETKKEYIKNLSDANSDYQNQISKIEDAIAVCDNPSLKQVLEDVKKEKERKLASLQESRNNELKTALNPAIESVEPKEEVKEEKVDNVNPIINTEINVLDEPIINEPETNNLEIPKIEPEIDIPVVNEENAIQNTEDQVKEDSMIGLDSILSSNDEIVMPKLTNVETDKIEMPKVEEKRVKVIFSKDVPDVAVKEILSSSTVMPNVYSYLGNNIISNGGILL